MKKLLSIPVLLSFFFVFLTPEVNAQDSLQSLPGYALVVNTWDDFPESNVTDVPAMPSQALQAYNALKRLGYDDERIALLLYHPAQNFIDYDGDGQDDLASAAIDIENSDVNKTRLLRELLEITSILNGTTEQMIIYVVGHGSSGPATSSLTFENGDSISNTEFAELFGTFNCARTVFLLDFCYSGSFADVLTTKQNRLIVTSSDSTHRSWCYWNWNLNTPDEVVYGSSGSAFFHPFWKRLAEGALIQDAFSYGREMCLHWADIDPDSRNIAATQNPQIVSTMALDFNQVLVRLSKDSTYFTPSSSSYVNEPKTLRVYVESSAPNETQLSLRAFGNNLNIVPSGWQTFVIQPGKKEYYDFGVSSASLGDFAVTIELKHGFQIVDFTTEILHVEEHTTFEWKVFTSYELRLSLVYILAGYTILMIYARYLEDDEEKLGNFALVFTLAWGCAAVIGIIFGLIPSVLQLMISQSVGRIEAILAITFMLCLSGLILLAYRKLEYSTVVGNIIVFLISIPLVIDWLTVSLFAWPEGLGGSVVWQVISTLASVVLGVLFDKAIKAKWPMN